MMNILGAWNLSTELDPDWFVFKVQCDIDGFRIALLSKQENIGTILFLEYK